jgi:hypothetical protein
MPQTLNNIFFSIDIFPSILFFLFYCILFVVLAGNVGFIFLISLVVFIFYNVCKNYFFVVYFLFILYGCFINFGDLSFQIKCSFFAFFFSCNFCCLSLFFMIFFCYNLFLGICNFWRPFFCFIFLGYLFIFLVFQICNESIVLVRFCTCSYHSFSELCFNLWLHITTSLHLICQFAQEPTKISITTQIASKDWLGLQKIYTALISYSFCPT